MKSDECLDGWSGGGCGVFIALNHQTTVREGLLSMGAPDSPVRQPRHSIVRVRAQTTVGDCLLVAPDSPVPHQTGTVHYRVRL
jgi:hypothetical protein